MDTVSGLDMSPTLKWCEEHSAVLLARLPPPTKALGMPFEIQLMRAQARRILSNDDMLGAIAAFPAAAQARLAITKVVMSPPAWFHRDSEHSAPKPTQKQEEALSPTAIIPSMITHPENPTTWWGFGSDIWLFDVLDSAMKPHIRRIMHLQGFIHECAHSFVTPEIHEKCSLRFPSGDEVVNTHFFDELYDVVNNHDPISHYASAYVDGNGKMVITDNEDVRLPLNEALVECITARLLGFAFRLDGTGLDPFRNREELRNKVDDYLNAERII